jgi:Epoxide hydrolase N terminus
MSGMRSLIGKRLRLATAILVGAIGIFLPAATVHAGTTPPAPAGAETLAPAVTTSTASPGATNAQAAGAAATAPADDKSIRPFQFHAPDEALADLRRRIAATKWQERETVTDASQGVQLATMRELARCWQTDYDWRKVEARLNALPQFMTNIDGVDIHFIHVRSKHPNALPVIITHGWPGSIIEQLKIIDPLTNPTAHGGSVSDAFHLVIPSMAGYGFSGKPTTTGWDPIRIARA